MAYIVVQNNRGGLHIKDEDTLEHAELHGYTADHAKGIGLNVPDGTVVSPSEEASEWMAALDKRKQDEWDAAHARPEAGAAPSMIPPVSRVD